MSKNDLASEVATALESLEFGQQLNPSRNSNSRTHRVQFYEDDSVLVGGATQAIYPALARGGAGIVVATKAHLDALARQLTKLSIDLPTVALQGRYIALDAEKTLAECMAGDWPDEDRVKALFGAMILQAGLATLQKKPRIAVFGEMVALLWAGGNPDAAIRMEQLWNELAELHSFSLLCGYPMAGFAKDKHDDRFRIVCAEHTQVVPSESYTELQNEDERKRAVSLLQQKAARLETVVSENEKLRQALNAAQQALLEAQKVAATGRLASSIAHEINNPLEAIGNFIYLAKTSDGIPEHVRQQLEVADREISRISQIAQQTLGIYRNRPKPAWVDAGETIEGVLTVFERRMRALKLKVHQKLGSNLQMHARQGELTQVVSNLIVNAIDASRQSGDIWVRAKGARDWKHGGRLGVRLLVADNGCGISPETGSRIFEPFFTTKGEAGTGIGLWLTKSLVEKQGGSVRFRSRKGEKSGTVMSVFLPLDGGAAPDSSGGEADSR